MDECQERGRAEGQLRAFESERRDTLSVLDVCKVARPAVADEHEQRVPAVAGQALVAAVLTDPGGGRWLGHHGVRPVPRGLYQPRGRLHALHKQDKLVYNHAKSMRVFHCYDTK